MDYKTFKSIDLKINSSKQTKTKLKKKLKIKMEPEIFSKAFRKSQRPKAFAIFCFFDVVFGNNSTYIRKQNINP